MKPPIWDMFLTERDKAVFSAGGFGARMGFGKRPAILVVDVNYAFCGDKPEPILESIKRWPTSCGEEAWGGVRVIKRLIEAARAKGLPVIYTTNKKRPDKWDNGSWSWKNTRQNERLRTQTNLDPNAVVDEIAPGPRDILIQKQKPSAFYATPLQSYLTLLGCDSLLVAGATTSGCVRASVLDAFSSNYRVVVVEDGCFDRSQASHAVSLCDMHAKYADIVESAEVIDFILTLPAGMFDLPAGEPAMQTAASRP
ncbi:MAG TPA: isochorismatase family protein [Verrucomicrobiae bacterium]|nr:isochorismatase family protein [Verrucomicrobiae bacterium]